MEAFNGRVIGEIGVAMAVEQLLRAGYAVAVPIVDDGYDLLAFDGRCCWRIQVKATASISRNGNRVRVQRGRKKQTSYCPDHVDAFVAIHVRRRLVMCVPVSKVKSRWLYFTHHERWSDFGVLRRIKPQRC